MSIHNVLLGKVNFLARKEENIDGFLTVRGGCPLGWETEIFDIGMLKNSEVSMVVFCYVNVVFT